jgi:hypothetical protein
MLAAGCVEHPASGEEGVDGEYLRDAKAFASE